MARRLYVVALIAFVLFLAALHVYRYSFSTPLSADAPRCTQDTFTGLVKYSSNSLAASTPLASIVKDIDESGACRIVQEDCKQLCFHFPHFAQYLLRCWSYWNQKKVANPILVTDYISQGDLKKRLPWKRRRFNKAFVKRLQDQIGLSVVAPSSANSSSATPFNISNTFSFVMADPWQDSQDLADLLVSERAKKRRRSKKDACKSPRVRILNREKSRTLSNAKEMALHFTKTFHLSPPVAVHYFERTSFQSQIDFMATTDILLSPHGAQLTSLFVMPAPCGSVWEFFPVDFLIPWFFGSLATSAASLQHYASYAGTEVDKDGTVWSTNTTLRVRARNVPYMCPNVTTLEPLMQKVLQEWYQCCEKQQRREEK